MGPIHLNTTACPLVRLPPIRKHGVVLFDYFTYLILFPAIWMLRKRQNVDLDYSMTVAYSVSCHNHHLNKRVSWWKRLRSDAWNPSGAAQRRLSQSSTRDDAQLSYFKDLELRPTHPNEIHCVQHETNSGVTRSLSIDLPTTASFFCVLPLTPQDFFHALTNSSPGDHHERRY